MAQKYLKDASPQEGVIYSLAQGGGENQYARLDRSGNRLRFQHRRLQIPLIKQWFKYCHKTLGRLGGARMGHDEYTHYYFGQAMYFIGDKGWHEMFPTTVGGLR